MSLIVPKPEEPKLPALHETMLPAISALTDALGIPRETLASDEEIQHAWHNLPREIKDIPPPLRTDLIARMCVAVSTGLFDGAMNYIWNAAILQLREKVRVFGLPVVSYIQQKDFEEKHLLELQDSTLLDLCLKLSIISEDGYFFLDQCRSVRNNFSAAHPTLGTVNDREFTTFLNRCVRYALSETPSPRGVDIQAFIAAVKGARFSASQLTVWATRLRETYEAQRQLLIGTVHGIYCDPNTPEPSRLNALDVCNELKSGFSATIRSELINKHNEYAAKGDEQRLAASSAFFERLALLTLLNETERHGIYYRAVDRLWNIHNGMNNFYNEPPFAERLFELSQQSAVPETVQEYFVLVVTSCYVGNGYGFSWSAQPFYERIIRTFSPREIATMIRLASSSDNSLGQRVIRISECKKLFKQGLSLIDPASIPNSAKTDYEKFLQ